ncbi:thiamine phosphate synthase [Marinicrinis lubricantis]|uniref:Thiamine phosphate synthase n=1 Tax=Marinicrinis lubricantis TaxID=2086470 RepID=A0ABW1INY8_9BACL
MSMPELHVISNGRQPLPQFASLAGKIFPHVTSFHLREKSKSSRELVQAIEWMLEAGVPAKQIVVNDRVDVAWSCHTGGAHLAYHSLEVERVKSAFPGMRTGCSVHSAVEAALVEQQGADYVLFGHVFPSQSKPDLPPRGLDALREAAASVRLPVIAIGGITPDNASQVIRAGASGIAVMSGIVDAADPAARVQAYIRAIHKGRRSHDPSC